MVKLSIVDDAGARREVNLDEDEITIGRKDGNTIRLEERNVSRVHARLVREDDTLFLEDTGSSFGVRVNGIRVLHRTAIQYGDEIGIGDFVLVIVNPAHVSGFDAHAAGTVVSVVSIPDSVRAQLRVIGVEEDIRIVQLEKTPTILGSSENNDVLLKGASVEAEHALVYYRNGCYEVESASEAARIWVNGNRCTSAVLEHGDEFRIGDIEITFSDSPAARMTARITEVAIASPMEGSSKKWLMGVGALLVIGGVVLTFDFLGGEDDLGDQPSRSRNAENQKSVGVPFGSRELQELDEIESVAAGGGPQVQNTKVDSLVEGHLRDAKEAMSQKRWHEAIEAYRIVLEKQPNHIDAGLKLERAKLELRRRKMIDNVDDLVTERNYVKAWELVEKYSNAIPPESIYHAEMLRRRLLVGEFAGPVVLQKAENALKRQDFTVALQLCDQVLEMQPTNGNAIILRNSILERQTIAAASKSNVAASRPKFKTESRKTSKKESRKERIKRAEEMYQAGRRAQLGGRNALAITKYKEALRAHSGYYKSHKALGILYAARGDSGKAIRHYKLYIKGNSKANDRKTVESAIQRLGGTL
jgi:pSer/pThr/pTyr-binding forkhead associated (FHA) protein/tetratricopeptide (TPR) repeat protein